LIQTKYLTNFAPERLLTLSGISQSIIKR